MEKTIDLIIRDAQAAQSVGDIRKQLKALTNEMLKVGDGSAEFNKLAMAAGDLKEKMNEARETVAAFNPDALEAVGNFAGKAASGVSLVTGAMGLFGKQSEDTEKALMKVQAAMAFAQGIQGIKGLGKAFQGLFSIISANPIGAAIAALAALGLMLAKIYNDYQNSNSAVAQANRLYEKQKELTSELVAQYDREIAVLEAQGASEADIIAIKRKKIEIQIAEQKQLLALHEAKLKDIEDNYSTYESLLSAAKATAEFLGQTEQVKNIQALIDQNRRERSEEEVKEIKAAQQAILDLENELTILDIQLANSAKNSAKAWKDANDKKVADQKAAQEQMIADMIALGDQLYAEQVALNEAAEALELEHNKRREQLYKEDVDKKRAAEEAKYRIRKKQAELERKIDEMNNQLRIDGIKTVLGAIGELTKDNAEAQKGIGAAVALVDTYVAAQKAFASQILPGDPTSVARGYIAAGLAVVAGLARVAAILKVDTDNPSASGSVGGGNTGTLTTSTQPNVNAAAQPTTFINQTTNNQSNPNIWVSVAEINGVNATVQAMEDRARL